MATAEEQITSLQAHIAAMESEQTFGGSNNLHSRIPVFYGNLGDNFSEWFKQFTLIVNSADWAEAK